MFAMIILIIRMYCKEIKTGIPLNSNSAKKEINILNTNGTMK